MRSFYIDDQYMCHLHNDGSYRLVRTSMLDSVDANDIVYYRYIPESETYTDELGVTRIGEVAYPVYDGFTYPDTIGEPKILEIADVEVVGADISANVVRPFASGEIGSIIKASFDEHWNGLDISVTFAAGDIQRVFKVADISAIRIPKEILSVPYKTLLVGFCGYHNQDNLVLTTKILNLGTIPKGAACSGETPDDPQYSVLQKVVSDLGDLTKLETLDKSSIVNAVNEVFNMAKDASKNHGRVFDTVDEMNAFIEAHKDELIIGDSFYIRDTNVPDYWWDGKSAQILETEKVDLSAYYTSSQVDDKLKQKANTTDVPTKVSQLENDSNFVSNQIDDSIVSSEKAHSSLKSNNEHSNSLVRTVSGEVIAVDDVSPLEHSVGCKVSIKESAYLISTIAAEYGIPLILAWLGITANPEAPEAFAQVTQGLTSHLETKGFIQGGNMQSVWIPSTDPSGAVLQKGFQYLPEAIMNETIKWLYKSEKPVLKAPFQESPVFLKYLRYIADTYKYVAYAGDYRSWDIYGSNQPITSHYDSNGYLRISFGAASSRIKYHGEGNTFDRYSTPQNNCVAAYGKLTILKPEERDKLISCGADVKTEVIPFPDQKGRDVISVPNVVGTSALAPDIWVGDEQDPTSEPIFFLPYNSNWNLQTGTQQEAQTPNEILRSITDISNVTVSRYGKNLYAGEQDYQIGWTNEKTDILDTLNKLPVNTRVTIAAEFILESVIESKFVPNTDSAQIAVTFPGGSRSVRERWPSKEPGTVLNVVNTFDIKDFMVGKFEVSNFYGVGTPTGGRSGFAKIKNIRFYIGDDAPFVYANVQRIKPNSDGIVYGIKSQSSNMTLLTDTPGANLEVVYNQDINQVHIGDITDIDKQVKANTQSIANLETKKADKTDLEKKADISYVNQSVAPALTCIVQGEVIAVDDVSPLEHSVGCKVERGNLWKSGVFVKTSNIDIISKDEIKCNFDSCNTGIKLSTFCPTLKAGDKVCFNRSATNDSDIGNIIYLNQSSKYFQSGKIREITQADLDSTVLLYAGSNTPNVLSNFVASSVPTPFTPYIPDLSKVTVSRYGGNLADPEFFPKYGAEKIGENEFKIFPVSPFLGKNIWENKSRYTGVVHCSLDLKQLDKVGLQLVWVYTDGTQKVENYLSTNQPYKHLDYRSDPMKTVDKITWDYGTGAATTFIRNFQVSILNGNFTPYVNPQNLTPSPDGTVVGMTSLSPSMTILTDTPGANLEVVYNQDINKVPIGDVSEIDKQVKTNTQAIDDLTNRLNAIGIAEGMSV